MGQPIDQILWIQHLQDLVVLIEKLSSVFQILKAEYKFSKFMQKQWHLIKISDLNLLLDSAPILQVLISEVSVLRLVCLLLDAGERVFQKKISWIQLKKSSRDTPNSQLPKNTWYTT